MKENSQNLKKFKKKKKTKFPKQFNVADQLIAKVPKFSRESKLLSGFIKATLYFPYLFSLETKSNSQKSCKYTIKNYFFPSEPLTYTMPNNLRIIQ